MFTVAPSVVVQKGVSGKAALGLGNNLLAEEVVGGSDAERGDATRIASIPPAEVRIPSESPAVQVSCGLHHTGENFAMKLLKNRRLCYKNFLILLQNNLIL